MSGAAGEAPKPPMQTIVVAWGIEVACILIGFMVAYIAGIEHAKFGALVAFSAAAPFAAGAIVEIGRIPLVKAAFSARGKIWLVFALFMILVSATLTFNNLLFGFERAFNLRIEQVRELAHAREQDRAAMVARQNDELREAKTACRKTPNRCVITALTHRQAKERADLDQQMNDLQAAILKRADDAGAQSNVVGAQIDSVNAQLQQVNGQLTDVQSALKAANAAEQDAITEADTARGQSQMHRLAKFMLGRDDDNSAERVVSWLATVSALALAFAGTGLAAMYYRVKTQDPAYVKSAWVREERLNQAIRNVLRRLGRGPPAPATASATHGATLGDSHFSLQHRPGLTELATAMDCVELFHATSHGDGTRGFIVAVPSSQPGDDPACRREAREQMRIALALCVAFETWAESGEGFDFRSAEHGGCGQSGVAVTFLGRAIAFQNRVRSLVRYASSHPARLNLPRKDPLEGSFCITFSAMCRSTARLFGPLPNRLLS